MRISGTPAPKPSKPLQIEPTTETPHVIIANVVAKICHGIRDIRAGRLNDRAIITLVHEASGVAKRDIKAVIDALDHLEDTYLKKATI